MKNPDDPKLTINVRLLRRIQRAIRKWPAHFNIFEWGYFFRYTPAKMPAGPTCETAACIAGWAVALGRRGGITNDVRWNIRGIAGQLLGLTTSQEVDLFSKFRSPYGPAETVEEACTRIDNFIAAHRACPSRMRSQVPRSQMGGSSEPS